MPAGAYLAIGLIGGVLLGLLVGWLLGRARPAAVDNRLETELRQQLAQREQELAQVRAQFSQASQSLATTEARRTSAEHLLTEQKALHERAVLENQQIQERARLELREAFKALSADALKQTHPEFLRLATETLSKFQEVAKGDLAQRQESIKTLVEPLKQQLETYQKRLQQSETTQASTVGEVRRQLESLAQSSHSLARETQQFRMALKSNQARGRWGEETLRRVVEAAGLSPHCDFNEQAQSGESKPDLIVHLPGNRFIIVDAKVPDLDFLNALDASDDAKRAEALAAHAAKLKGTIKALADRDYPGQFPNALDHVVLFLPAESLFSAALEGDDQLILWAASRKILLATPASLIALLRAVSVSWQQYAQTENAQKIAAAAQEFYARVTKFTEHLDRIRSGLERANVAFNEASASFHSRVRPAGDRLAELGGSPTGKSLEDIQPLESGLRETV